MLQYIVNILEILVIPTKSLVIIFMYVIEGLVELESCTLVLQLKNTPGEFRTYGFESIGVNLKSYRVIKHTPPSILHHKIDRK